MNTRRLRTALREAVDLVLDALEEPPTVAEKVRRRRLAVPPLPLSDRAIPEHIQRKVEYHLQKNGYDLLPPK